MSTLTQSPSEQSRTEKIPLSNAKNTVKNSHQSSIGILEKGKPNYADFLIGVQNSQKPKNIADIKNRTKK